MPWLSSTGFTVWLHYCLNEANSINCNHKALLWGHILFVTLIVISVINFFATIWHCCSNRDLSSCFAIILSVLSLIAFVLASVAAFIGHANSDDCDPLATFYKVFFIVTLVALSGLGCVCLCVCCAGCMGGSDDLLGRYRAQNDVWV